MFGDARRDLHHSAPGQPPSAKNPERVSGPWQDLFVAAYTSHLDGGFYGYSKIFLARPQDPWVPGALAKLGTDRSYPDEDSAIEAVEKRTHDVVDDMHDVFKSIAAFRPPR